MKSSGALTTFNKSMKSQSKVMVRMLWVLRLLWPTDLQECLRVIQFFEPVLGVVVDPLCIVTTFLAQTIKWPPAVAYFLSLLQAANLRSHGIEQERSDLMFNIYMEVIKWSDGKVWGDMFVRMHGSKSSRLDAISGLNNSAEFMGIITKADTGGELALGRGQNRYEFADEEGLVAARQLFTFMFQRAERVKIVWPATKDETQQFADALLSFAREVRSFKLGGDGVGLPGGRDPEHMYNAKSFVRMMLLQCMQLFPSALDKFTVGEIAEWSPDERKRLKAWEDMTGRQIQEEFDIDPMMFSCWQCMINMCMDGKAIEQALKMQDDDFFEVADKYRLESMEDGATIFAPGPHIIIASWQ